MCRLRVARAAKSMRGKGGERHRRPAAEAPNPHRELVKWAYLPTPQRSATIHCI
jgi:hypothetical protein